MDKKQQTSQGKNGRWFVAGFVMVIFFGIVLSGCMPSGEVQKEAAEKVAEAQVLLNDRYYMDALRVYEEARTIDPGNPAIYTGIAGIYLLKNRVEDAREVLEIGSKDSREPSMVFVDLGWLEMSEENANLAVSYCKSAVRSDSENYEARYCLAQAYVENCEFDKAKDGLNIPESAGEWYVRGKILEAVLAWDDTNTGLDAINSALNVGSDDEGMEEIADLIRQNLDGLEKIEEESFSDVHREVMLSYNALVAGYEDIVINKLESYTEDNPQYWDLFSYLGRAYYLDGDMERAETYLSEAVTLNPTDPYSAWYLARVSSDNGKSTEADSLYKRSIALSPVEERSEICDEYVEFLIENGQYAEAADLIEEIEKVSEGNEVYRYKLMRVSSLLNRDLYDEASVLLDEIVNSDDSGIVSEGTLGAEYAWARSQVAYSMGSREEALSLIEDALAINSAEPKLHLLRGLLLFELGQSEDAQKALERAVDLDLDGDVSTEAVKILDRI